MRPDSLGIFWEDLPPPPRVKKEKKRVIPPEKFWLKPDYLPGIERLRLNPPVQSNDGEIVSKILQNRQLVFDIESYPNFFLCAFKSLDRQVQFWYVKYGKRDDFVNNHMLDWLLKNATLIGFNSRNYDITMLSLALCGYGTETLKEASDKLIVFKYRPYELLREYRAKKCQVDTIDIQEPLPGDGGLKIYSGRVHTRRMQDLPFHPDTHLSVDQALITVDYCVNDLDSTNDVFGEIKEPMRLRYEMSKEYGIDLRSKSDAQIAEAVIGRRISELNAGAKIEVPFTAPGTIFKYQPPAYMQFSGKRLREIYQEILNTDFVVSESGTIKKPKHFDEFDLHINDLGYTIGIGGLHSTESDCHYKSENGYKLISPDVVSYYPFIILNNNLFPAHLGPNFLTVYRPIVEMRLDAKARGLTEISERLKIVINGSFGKLSSPYSILYSPNLLIQVTLTGQLTLLMLIEAIESIGIRVISANTDGIVINCPEHREYEVNHIIKKWETITNFTTEMSYFKSLYISDVNSYIGLPDKGKPKLKGRYSQGDISRNPSFEITVTAIINYLSKGTPIEDTINSCRDIRQFVKVRNVKGGGVKVWGEGNTEYLGKAVRFYYSTEVEGDIIYAKTGGKVPVSDGARPLMELGEFPTDVNFPRYIEESYKILESFGTVKI